jgi:hypothetical protein
MQLGKDITMTVEEFGARATSMLDVVLAQGFERPIYFVCIAIDGRVLKGTYGVDDRVLIDYPGEADMLTPIHILFVDCRGKAQHMTIEDQESRHKLN